MALCSHLQAAAISSAGKTVTFEFAEGIYIPHRVFHLGKQNPHFRVCASGKASSSTTAAGAKQEVLEFVQGSERST